MFTRSQFESACKAFAAKHASSSSSSPDTRAYVDWTWIERYPYGYLSRSKTYPRKTHATAYDSSNLGDETDLDSEFGQDIATAPTLNYSDNVTCQQYIVFSATFQVPTFYFTIHNSSLSYVFADDDQSDLSTQGGAPLSLDELMSTCFFKFEVPGGSEATGFALTLPGSSFPLLSQGEHPTLGTPCWYLHPCETSTAVDELVRDVAQNDWDQELRQVRWMELWVMTVGAVVDL